MPATAPIHITMASQRKAAVTGRLKACSRLTKASGATQLHPKYSMSRLICPRQIPLEILHVKGARGVLQIDLQPAHMARLGMPNPIQRRINRDTPGIATDHRIPHQPGRVNRQENPQHDDSTPEARAEKYAGENERRNEHPDGDRMRKRQQAEAQPRCREPAQHRAPAYRARIARASV